jgi:hypothetical protein
MPVLDKLTTIVEWDVDTSQLERYEALVGTAESKTSGLSSAAVIADEKIGGIKSAAVRALGQDVEIANESLAAFAAGSVGASGKARRIGAAADAAARDLSGFSAIADAAGDATEGAAVDMQRLAIESNEALRALVQMGRESQDTKRNLDEQAKATAAAAKATAEAKKRAKEFDDGLKNFGGSIAGTLGHLAKMGGIIAGIFTGAGVLASREIGIQSRLAASVGMTTDAYLAWDGVLSQMGLNGERAVDMVEEAANKLGELKGLGEMSSAQDALKMVGIEFANIKDLAPEEQFREIMSAAKDLEDEGIARSAVDMIFGGEANKVLGHLRTLDGSLEDILNQYQKYNFLTERGVEGSSQLADAMKNVTTAGKTFLAEITGRLAETLGPTVDKFFDWALANRQIINQKIEGAVRAIADALRWVAWGAEKTIKLVDALGGAGSVIKEVALAFAAWKVQSWVTQLSALATKMTLSGKALSAMKMAAEGLKSVGLTGLFSAAYLAVEDLYYFLTGGKSAIGQFMDDQLSKAENAMLKFFGVLDENMTAQEQRDITAGFQQGFMDGIDLASRFFNGMLDGAVNAFNGLGALLSGFIDSAGTAFSNLGDSISGFFKGVFGTLIEKFYAVVDGMREKLRSIPLLGDLIGDGEVRGGLASAAPVFAAGGTPAFASAGIIPRGSASVTPVSSPLPGWSRGAIGQSTPTTINAPINIHARTNASAQEIASEVSKALNRSLDNVKTTGIRR